MLPGPPGTLSPTPGLQPLMQSTSYSTASSAHVPMSVSSTPASYMGSTHGSDMNQIMLVPVVAHPSVQTFPTPLSSGAYSSYPTTDYSTPSTASMYHYSSHTHTPPPPSHIPLEDAVPSIAVLDETKRVVEGPIAERGPRRPKLGNSVEASCPILGALHRGNELPDLLPVQKLRFTAQVHIAVVVVTCELETEASENLGKAHRLAVYCPKTAHTTFTEARIENLSKPLIATTVLVPVDEVQAAAQPYRPPFDSYDDPLAGPDYDDPNLFIFEIPPQFSFKAGHKFKVTLSYFEPLVFSEGKYSLRLPTTIPSRCLPNRTPIQSILEVTATVDIGLPLDVQLEVNQPSRETQAEEGCGVQTVKLDTEQQLTNIDFELHYKVWGGSINAVCYTQPPYYGADLKPALAPATPGLIPTANTVTVESATAAANNNSADATEGQGGRSAVPLSEMGRLDNLSTFCVALAPPDPNNSDRHARAVVFILDRSGSMQGKPLEYAMQAVLVGLGMLGPEDVFGACCFDHEVEWWSPELVPATKENVSKCEGWIQSNFCARGLTNIKTPLMQALDLLEAAQQLPFVFLLTDGCTADEREICQEVDKRLGAVELKGPYKTRINTFAIGPFANHYFLKHLALTARGLFDVAFRANSIQIQMEQMLAACAHPVLSDVSIKVPGLDDSCVAVLPQPVPDLFCGLPLLVVGKFAGQWPGQVVLRGRRPGGNHDWMQEVASMPVESDALPLGKIWAKAFLDHETAAAWRCDDKKAVQRIIATSIATGVPCPPYTQMVGIAVAPEEYEQLRADIRVNKRQKVTKYAIAGAAGVAVVTGAAALLSLGDPGATFQNIPFDAFNADCCECCGHCCGSLVAGGCVVS